MHNPKFNVGDHVVVTDPGDNEYFFKTGAQGVILYCYGDSCQVQFTQGDYDTDCRGIWYADCTSLQKVSRYSSTFTEKAKDKTSSGHVKDSGLQKHSIGNAYPFAVVAYHSVTPFHDRLVYTVENLETGEVAMAFAGKESPRQWAPEHLHGAVAFAERCAWSNLDLFGNPISWRVGRPTFDGKYLVVKDTESVRTVLKY